MNLNKSLEYFNPETIETPIHIIGVGAIGSTVATQLARLGLTNLILYDMDVVSAHNIANQAYTADDIGKPKVDAIAAHLRSINPEINLILRPKGFVMGMGLDGYVILAVDSIELRKAIMEENQYNRSILAMFDFRMRLSDAQHYAADWKNQRQVTSLITSADFTSAEAKEDTPVSACGTTLSVYPTVATICSLGVSNLMNFAKGQQLKNMILIDAFSYELMALPQ